MKFRVGCISYDLALTKLNKVTSPFEDVLNKNLGSVEYGSNINQISIFFVSLNDDEELDQKWLSKLNKIGKFKIPFSKNEEWRGYFGLGIHIKPSRVNSNSESDLRIILLNKLKNQMECTGRKIPTNLNYEKLVSDIKQILKIT